MRLAVAVVVLLSANAAWAQTADEVIEKSLAALGGRAAHAKIKTRSMAGTITLGTPAGDIPGTIEIVNALPNKTRTLIKADLTSLGAGPLVIDQRFDGKSGYVLDTLQGNREITGNQLDNMRNTGLSACLPHLQGARHRRQARKARRNSATANSMCWCSNPRPAPRFGNTSMRSP